MEYIFECAIYVMFCVFRRWSYFSPHYLTVVAIDFVLICVWDFDFIPLDNDTKRLLFQIIVGCIAIIPFSAITYLRLKTPQFDDNFAIRGMWLWFGHLVFEVDTICTQCIEPMV